jgi:hypothetical protein
MKDARLSRAGAGVRREKIPLQQRSQRKEHPIPRGEICSVSAVVKKTKAKEDHVRDF